MRGQRWPLPLDAGGGFRVGLRVMELKDVVKVAREHIAVVFDGEDVSNTRLEEVEYSVDDNEWKVTFSFLRPTGTVGPYEHLTMFRTAYAAGSRNVARDYKVVVVNNGSETATAVRNRSESK